MEFNIESSSAISASLLINLRIKLTMFGSQIKILKNVVILRILGSEGDTLRGGISSCTQLSTFFLAQSQAGSFMTTINQN